MKKNKLIKLGCIIVIAIIMYINFVTIFYSIDTYKILALGYKEYGIQNSLNDGRPFMTLICLLADKIDVSISILYFFNLIASIVIFSICVIKIHDIIQRIKPSNNKGIKLLLLIISYTYIFNFMTIDNMSYIENIIMAVSVLLYIIAAEKMVIKGKKIQALILTSLGVMFYQGTISVWISFCCLLVILKHKKINKELIKDIFIVAFITLIASVSNFIFIDYVKSNIKNLHLQNRLSFMLVNNIRYSLSNISRLLVDTIDLFPRGVCLGFVFFQSFIVLIYNIKNNNIKNFFMLLMTILIYIISSLLLTGVYWGAIHGGNGRVFGSIGAIIPAIAIYIYCKTKIFETEEFLKKAVIVLIILYSIINFGNITYLTNGYSKNNDLDKKFSMELIKRIEEYEKQNNIEITQMAFKYIKKENEKLEVPSNRYGVSRKKTGQYCQQVLQLYTGRIIERIDFDSEIFDKYFSNNEEKMKFIGDTVYFTISYK